MKHFGKNRFISFFALLLVLTLALSMNSVFAADTAATGTDSAAQQESGEPPASKDSAVSEQNPEQNQEQKPENSASPENPTTPEAPKNLGWVTDNNETRYYDTENHFVTGMNAIEGKNPTVVEDRRGTCAIHHQGLGIEGVFLFRFRYSRWKETIGTGRIHRPTGCCIG